MKNTIEIIDKKVKAAADARAELEKARKDSFTEKQELKRKAEAAAEAGNVDLYLEINKQIERADAAAHVREVQLNKKSAPVTLDEVKGAWSDFVTGYNKSLGAGLAELEKVKNALLDRYSSLLSLQQGALEIRERLAGYVGEDVCNLEGLFPMDFVPYKKNLEGGNVQTRFGSDPYAVFYLAHKAGTKLVDPVLQNVNAVMIAHRSK